MEQEVAQSTPEQLFDAALTSESTYVEPPIDHVAEATKARDAKGKFTSEQPTEEKPAETERKADAEKPKAAKPRNDPEARIAQAIGRQREAERRAEEAERRAREAESRTARPADAKQPAKPAQADRFPRFDEWSAQHPDTTHDDYLDARDEWRDQRNATVQRERFEESQREQSFEKRAATFSERFAAAQEADPELSNRIDQRLLTAKPYSTLTKQDKAVIAAIPDRRERENFAFLCFLADRWIDSEHAVPLLEHLSNPQTFQRLATLPPDQVIEELARVKAGFPAASSKESRGPAAKPQASQAHPPIKPLGSAPRVPDDDGGSDDEPLESFIRRENAKDRKAGRL